MDTHFPAQPTRVKVWFIHQLKFLTCASALFALFTLPVVAQTNPLVVSTVAGLANFGTNDGVDAVAKFYAPTSVAVDGMGNVYVADALNDTIRKVSSTGVVTTLAGTAQMTGTNDGMGSAARFNQPYGVAVDGTGNIFVADTTNSTIRKITTNGLVITFAGSSSFVRGYTDGSTNVAAFNRPYGIAVDSSNNIYVADTYNHLIRKIANGAVTTLAGDTNTTDISNGTNYGSTDGTGGGARFQYPYAVAVDHAGNVFVADTGNNLIRRITPAGVVRTIAGTGGTLFSVPTGIAVDSATNIYVADNNNQIVRKLTPSGTNWILLSPPLAGDTGFTGAGDGIFGSTNARFNFPWGLAVDSATNVYVGDSGNGNIREITPSGKLSTLAGPVQSYETDGPVDGPGSQARFFQPYGVAVDSATNLYVADYFDNCIRQITPGGTVTTIAGSISGDIGSADGTNNNAEFYYPSGLCLDAATNIYVADGFNSTVRKMTFDGTNWITTTIAGQVENYNYADGVGTNALFYVPAAVAVDSATNLYVADSYNNAIRMITPNGTVSTYAGNGILAGGYLDATGTNALFNYPTGVAVDSSTNIYVADAVNNAIRWIAPGAVVTTLTNGGSLNNPEGVAVDANGNVYVGNTGSNTIFGMILLGKNAIIAGTTGFVGSADGLGPAAQFYHPSGLAVDASSNVYVADTFNNTIRKGTVFHAGQSAVLSLATSPSGLPLAANGTNYPSTPQFPEFATGSIITVIASAINDIVFTNANLTTTTNYYLFTNWTSNSVVGVSSATNYNVTLNTNVTLTANYLPAYALAVIASPVSGGMVSGGGTFLAGSTNTVMATPTNGFVFTNWTVNGAVASTNANYTFTLTSNVTLVANFAPLYTVALSASPANGGTVTGNGTFASNSTITVTATATNGFVFTNWTQGASTNIASTNANYTFTLTSNVTLVANFTPLYTVALSASPVSGETVTGNGTFASNSTITVTATATNGFVFTNWTQGASTNIASTNANYTFTVTSNVTLVANFAPLYTVALSASPVSGGTVTGNGTFASNSMITVTATATNGFVFTNWTRGASTNIASTNANYSFTVTSNVVLVANFAPLYTVALSASPTNGGTVTGSGVFASNSTITVTATATNGFVFTNWTQGVSTNIASTNANYTFTVTSNVTLVANFAPLYTVALSASPPNGGLVSGNGVFASNSTITVTATASNGFVFTNWTDGVSTNVVSMNTNYTFTIISNVALVANFVPAYAVALSASPVNGGTVTGNGTFASNSTITVTATATNGFVFTNWTDGVGTNIVSTNANYTFTIISNVALVANFAPLYTVALSASPTNGGTVTGNGTYASNSTITVTATATNGFVFTNWTQGASTNIASTNASYTFTVTSNVTLVANFAPLYNVTLSTSPTNGGTVTGNGTYASNSTITVTATATNGFVFTNWTQGASTNIASTNASYTFTVTSNVTLVANFAPLYNVTLSASPTNGGTVTGNGTFASNSTITVTATATNGFVFTNWTDGVSTNITSTNANYTFTIISNVTLVANFAPLYTVALSASPSSGGTVTGNGTFASNSTITVTATASNGYAFTNWTTGVSTNVASTSPSYMFTLDSNVTLVANFVLTPPQIGVFKIFNGTTNVITNGLTTVDFGTVQISQPGPIVTVLVTNIGGQPLTLTNISVPSGYTLDTNPPLTITNFPATITGLSNGTFSLQLNTTNISTNTGNVTITNNDSTTNNPFIFALTGTVTSPAPEIAVLLGTNVITNGLTTVNFGSVPLNQTATLTFTVTNKGLQALNLGTPTVPLGYTLTTNPPATIAAGSNGFFSVQFNSTTVGVSSGSISLTNNDTNNNPFAFPITGLITVKIISLGGDLAFGGVPVNTSAMKTLTISNAGNATLTVTNIHYPTGFSGAFSNTIAPGGSTNVTVTFSPLAATNYSGGVTVQSDATSGSDTLPVSGFGQSGTLFLTVITNGPGTVAPVLTARPLVLNRKYTLTATAKTGNVFAGWTGSTNSTKNPLAFTMALSTVLEANFITNPFLPVKGSYNGLFTASNGITEQTAGMLKGLTVSTKGAYSGALLINGASHGISGTFNLEGQATNKITRPAIQGGPLLLEMTLDLTSFPPQVTGTVTGTNGDVPWVSTNLIADFATNFVPSSEYTLVIPPDTNVAPSNSIPGGDGYALITNHIGTAKITGALADGTAFSQSVPVSRAGDIPIYASLYGNKGLLLGWINLEASNAPGAVAWVHPPIRTGLFTSAFTNTNTIALSPWTNPPVISPLLTNLLVFEMASGVTTQTNAFVVTISNSNFKLGEISGPTNLIGSINPKTGLLTVTTGKGESKITGYGAILPNATNGGGYFVTKTNSGAVILKP